MALIMYDIDYSIVICTYNPEERLFKRCLDAVYNLDIDGITTEIILVDNNSLLPVNSLQYVLQFLKKTPSVKTIMVAAQGLRHARIAAIKEARGRHIVFFDSDNEPEKDYVQELKKLNEKFPEVAALGPGEVLVDFVDGIDKKIEEYARIAFQERHEKAIRFSGLREWQSCYPFGTGLCINSFLLKEYVNLAKQGRFTMPGQTGDQLTSCDDIQMVLLCISKEYAAGVSPALKLRHMIPETHASFNYLQRLAYDRGLCYERCRVQVFPEYKEELEKKIISGSKFLSRVLKEYLKVRLSSDPHTIFDLVHFISLNAGAYIALNKQVPESIKRVTKYLKLDGKTQK
jgi:glycosyltransferase involved in cell wall biosynthesis